MSLYTEIILDAHLQGKSFAAKFRNLLPSQSRSAYVLDLKYIISDA